jgi:hypothetical protein
VEKSLSRVAAFHKGAVAAEVAAITDCIELGRQEAHKDPCLTGAETIVASRLCDDRPHDLPDIAAPVT